MPSREIIRFLVLVFVLGIGTQLAALYGGLGGPGNLWLRATMWTPPAAALLAGAVARKRVWESLCRGAPRWWPLAFLLGWIPTLVDSLLLWVSGTGSWNSAMFPLAEQGGIAGVEGVAMVLGVGPQGWAFFMFNMLVTLVFASALTAVVGGLGEELGWRAVLQRGLDERMRPLLAAALVGAIWAYWHLPANLAGYNDPQFPVLSALLFFPVSVVGFGLMYAWLWRRSGGAVWPVAIVHGANNTINAGFVVTERGPVAEISAAMVTAGLLILVFGWLLWSDRPGMPVRESSPD